MNIEIDIETEEQIAIHYLKEIYIDLLELLNIENNMRSDTAELKEVDLEDYSAYDYRLDAIETILHYILPVGEVNEFIDEANDLYLEETN